jgi:hypothetical protein
LFSAAFPRFGDAAAEGDAGVQQVARLAAACIRTDAERRKRGLMRVAGVFADRDEADARMARVLPSNWMLHP